MRINPADTGWTLGPGGAAIGVPGGLFDAYVSIRKKAKRARTGVRRHCLRDRHMLRHRALLTMPCVMGSSSLAWSHATLDRHMARSGVV